MLDKETISGFGSQNESQNRSENDQNRSENGQNRSENDQNGSQNESPVSSPTRGKGGITDKYLDIP